VSKLLAMSQVSSEFFVLKPNHEELQTVLAIDMSVYSRNRCFRILGSSKFGENRPLKIGETISQEVGVGKTCPYVLTAELKI
jgi:hypothetical protein